MNEIVPQAQWHGPPSRERIAKIMLRTHTDNNGRRYWRKSLYDGWRRLLTLRDFAELNAALGPRDSDYAAQAPGPVRGEK